VKGKKNNLCSFLRRERTGKREAYSNWGGVPSCPGEGKKSLVVPAGEYLTCEEGRKDTPEIKTRREGEGKEISFLLKVFKKRGSSKHVAGGEQRKGGKRLPKEGLP